MPLIVNKNGNISLINKSGNVGIGTGNPDTKLTVKGTIHAEEVIIDLNVPAPDYVFKENYQLMSIKEVEKFINKKSHLPGIPSANEFEKNGVKQAEMDMNLLEKIEKLEKENLLLKLLSDRLSEIEKLVISEKNK
ncbi:tail fiber protein [Aquimarina sp. RZ0]|uniref:tail fiber protein n=1 Tax=Aquimarina sp. RZ0 TaxID=2607730 RepID=UPI0011F241EC|nr:tail fiber protein [Aquimarina sp. RZ0]KAA1243962.1 hypothetical protein F0000_18595 [Aquimarina sp. RZ0]